MKVSVILPIYNGEATLAQTLESLAVQTFTDFELIACIDGTYDGSRKIVEDYRPRFRKLTILQNEKNRGLGPTMNRMVHHVCGEYIAVAEQDDYYYPYRLEKEVALLDSKPEVGLVSGIAEFWDGEKVTGLFPGRLVHNIPYPQGEEFFLLNYKKQIKVVNSAMMFRKRVHVDYGLYFTQHYPSISVDWTYVLRFCLCSEVYGISEVLVRLDRRNTRDSVTNKKDILIRASYEVIRSFLYEYPSILDVKDYKYARTTIQLMELPLMKGLQFIQILIVAIIQNPGDLRWFNYLRKRFVKKFKKL